MLGPMAVVSDVNVNFVEWRDFICVCHGRDREPVESAILPVEIAIAISTGRDYDRNLYW
jgi:hypothetical protein